MPSLKPPRWPALAGAGAVSAAFFLGYYYTVEKEAVLFWKQLNKVSFSCLQLVAQNSIVNLANGDLWRC